MVIKSTVEGFHDTVTHYSPWGGTLLSYWGGKAYRATFAPVVIHYSHAMKNWSTEVLL
jgi:hypothetical protein